MLVLMDILIDQAFNMEYPNNQMDLYETFLCILRKMI
jgi:hypothetical protein